MRILLVAPPGAGKGTQAERLADRYRIEHLASGDMLRREMSAGTELGERVRAYVEAGDLAPDELIMRLVLDRVATAAAKQGYVLDGFPRTVDQARAVYEEALRQVLDGEGDARLQAVIHLEVSGDEVLRRIRARKEGRPDDADERVVVHRLEVYERQTKPLLAFYRERGLLVEIDGEQGVEDVSTDLYEALDPLTVSPVG